MTEKIEVEHVAQQKGDDVETYMIEELTQAEDKRLLRRIDMWLVSLADTNRWSVLFTNDSGITVSSPSWPSRICSSSSTNRPSGSPPSWGCGRTLT